MPWGLAAAAVIGAGASMATGAMQADAVGDAQDSANAAQERAQAQMRGDLMPYMNAGTNALAPAQNLLGINGPDAAKAAMDNFQASPGYQYTFDQAMRGVNSNSAAAGMAASGANMKALQDRGAQVANQEFGNYYNRLMGMVGVGQSSAAGVGASGVQTAAGQAQTDASAGSSQASIYGNTASGVGNAVNTGMNNYQYQQRTNSLYDSGTPKAASSPFPGY